MATAAPAVASSPITCPTLASFSNFSSAEFIRVILQFDGADSTWLATATSISPERNQSGFFTLPTPPTQTVSSDGTAFFDYSRTYRGGADEDLTFGFTLSKGTQVCPYSATLHYFNPR